MPRNVAIGLGLMEFPFSGVGGFWRWVDLCEAGGVDSLWQTDRIVSREPILECMSVMAALAGRTRRLKFGVIAGIRAAAAAEGRAIDDDHYGAGIPFRFGQADDPGLERLFEAYRKRTGRDPLRYFAIGDAEAVVERIAAYVAAGISKFILRPAARGDDEMLSQTRRLIDEVLPLVAARWPKPAKRRAAAE